MNGDGTFFCFFFFSAMPIYYSLLPFLIVFYFLFFIRFFLRLLRSLCLFIIFLLLLRVLIKRRPSSFQKLLLLLPLNADRNQFDARPKAERFVKVRSEFLRAEESSTKDWLQDELCGGDSTINGDDNSVASERQEAFERKDLLAKVTAGPKRRCLKANILLIYCCCFVAEGTESMSSLTRFRGGYSIQTTCWSV